MRHADNEKWKKKNNGMNRTAESVKNQNALRKGKLQVLGNIGSGHHQTSGEKIKEYLRRTRKLLETKLYSRNFLKIIDNWAFLLGIILKVDKGGTQTNEPEGKKVQDDALGLTSER